MELTPNQIIDVNELINDPSIPKSYANNFLVSNSTNDATMVVLHGMNAQCVIPMSWASLKVLQMQVNNCVDLIETVLGVKIAHPMELQDKQNEYIQKQMEALKNHSDAINKK